jgi:hypothetical protein
VDVDRAASLARGGDFDAATLAHAGALAAISQVNDRAPGAPAWWTAAVEALSPVPDDDLQLELLNQLCEAAMAAAEPDPEYGRTLLRQLAPVIASLGGGEGGSAATQALAWALLGEALAALDDPGGESMLERAAALSEGLPVRDHVLTFVAQSLGATDLRRAIELAGAIESPPLRFDTRLGLLQRAQSAGVPAAAELLPKLEADTAQLDEFRQIHALARLGTVTGAADAAAARRLYEAALAAVPNEQPQLRALQLAGLAASASAWDADWAARLYDQALAAARDELEPVRRVVAQIAVAYQMAQAEPAAAQPFLDAALRDAPALSATWELAHVLEVLLDPRGRPEMDLQAAVPLLEAALARVTDDDPRVPGVFGLPEAAHAFMQVDPQRAVAVCRRWLRTAQRAGDAEGMIEAALGIRHADPAAGEQALHEVALGLTERGDAFAMSQFARAAAGADPRLAAAVASVIPESREQSRALAGAAAALWESDPDRAGELIGELPTPDERSAAMLAIFDRAAGTANLPRPAAESEVSVCCSTIPQIPPDASERLKTILEANG